MWRFVKSMFKTGLVLMMEEWRFVKGIFKTHDEGRVEAAEGHI